MVMENDDIAVKNAAAELRISENWDHINPGDFGSSVVSYRGNDMYLFTVKLPEFEDEQVYQAFKFVDAASDDEMKRIVSMIVGHGTPRIPHRYFMN